MYLIKCPLGLCHSSNFVLVIITVISNDSEMAAGRATGEIVSIYQEHVKVSVD